MIARITHQVRRIPGIGTLRGWQQGRLGPADYHRPILGLAEGNACLQAAVAGGAPFLAGRFGKVELECVTHYSRSRQHGAKRDYPRLVVARMGTNAGFFPLITADLDRFAEEYLAAARLMDILGVWFNRGENDLVRLCCQSAALVPLMSLEPYYHTSPWSAALAGKRVLVVHPFADSIRDNYAERRTRLFADERVLPDFTLVVMKAVQSIAGEPAPFDSWFDALDSMKTAIGEVDFDVCIVGAGAYGLPLAAHAKRLGRIAIHLGGATQVLFGIQGRRWDGQPLVSRLYNEHWTRPSPSETPRDYRKVEGGAYW